MQIALKSSSKKITILLTVKLPNIPKWVIPTLQIIGFVFLVGLLNGLIGE